MSEYAIIFQVLGALVVLLFIFLTYINTKTWRWVHVTFTFLVFAASIALCVYAAMATKTRTNWIKAHDKLVTDVANLETQVERTTRGDPNDIEHKTPSVISVREELERTIVDRGRVWRGCMLQQATPDGNVVLFTSPPVDPNNPPPAGTVKKNNIQVKTIVHAFGERQVNENVTVPGAYIGEFEAAAATDQSVTLKPTVPLSQEQFAAGRGVPWTLYESCPVDGHDWFASLNEADLRAMLPAQLLGPAANRVLESYLRDGKEALDTDPPENVWYEVKFVQEHEVVVDAAVGNIDVEPFNTEGQAVLDRLRRRGASAEEPGKVTFGPKEGQIHTAVLDQQTAQALIADGKCELQRKIYRRKLTDYERNFRAISERTVDLSGRIRQLDLDNKAMLAATEKANAQATLVEELNGKLNDDLGKVKYERDELKKYSEALNRRLADEQTQLSQLYRSNKAIGRELAELTANLTEEIDRRTRQATARNP